MRRNLLATTAIVALALPASVSVQAQDITTARTTPVTTSTANNGAPGNVRITSTGSVTLTSGNAVTMDSNHNVVNEGTIRISNADNAVGILVNAGTTGDITNNGTILIDENYTVPDGDNDGDGDGPFALGTGRYGIRTLGAHTGAISHGGTITVEGNNSYGIYLGGPQTGNVTLNNIIAVTGDDSTAVRLDDVTGNVRLAGTINVRGENAIGAHLAGDVTGRLVVQGALSSSGYRFTTAPTNVAALDADDLLQGGPALLIEGNVTGGIVVAIPPRDADTANPDEDSDGIPDATEGSGAIQSFGSAPAMVLGSATDDITIGAVTGTATLYGVQIDGLVAGQGVYAGVDATGLQIAGRGGDVTIANGIGIAGTVGSSSNAASATAVRIGAGANTPLLHVTGSVEAATNNTATSSATGIRVEVGANVPTIRNAGRVRTISGADGSNTAIIDLSGNVDLIENSGLISATGATATTTRNVAIDLTANGGGATVRQTLVATGITAPSIVGDIRFGTGADTLDLDDGTYAGTSYFGDGADTLSMSGDALFTGTAQFGGGADILGLAGSAIFDGTADFGGDAGTLTLADTARFSGSLTNASGLAITMTGGLLDVETPAQIGSLDMGSTSILVVTLDDDPAESTFLNISGAATFADGATIAPRLATLDDVEGTYLVLDAGTLTGAGDLEINENLLPYLFKGTIGIDNINQSLSVTIARRTAQELELNAAASSAYDAIFAALQEDDQLEQLFLATTSPEALRGAIGQMLPDHAGGTFEGLSLGLRTLSRGQSDPTGPVFTTGGLDVIVSGGVWSSGKEEGATAGYDLAGLGASVSAEFDTEYGAFGAGLGWVFSDYDQGGTRSSAYSHAYELSLYWRGEWDNIKAFGRGGVGIANFNGERILRGTLGTTPVERVSEGDWSGNFYTASGGVSYQTGGTMFLRPNVSFDYLRLSEKAYEDTGGGVGLDLSVDKRSSDELAVNAGLAAGIDFSGNSPGDTSWFRLEGEGGWRQIAGGGIGATTASFEGGTPFTIIPEDRESGAYARLRVVGGGELFEVGGELGGEQRNGETALSLRGSLRMAF